MVRSDHKLRIGVLGGTFDPVHYGHLMLAEEARQAFNLDRVLFVPARKPPHKHRRISDSAVRLAMLKLAIKGNAAFAVSRIELDRDGPSYSVVTMRLLREKYPRADFYFLAGADALPDLHRWKNFEELCALCVFVIARRPDFALQRLPENVRVLDGSFLNISSRLIRARIRSGISVRYLLPERVHAFIDRHGLYRPLPERK